MERDACIFVVFCDGVVCVVPVEGTEAFSCCGFAGRSSVRLSLPEHARAGGGARYHRIMHDRSP